MTFLPYEKFVIKTRLDPDTVLERLNEVTETSSRWTFFWQDHKPYRGKITENEFEIHRWISYRNSFLPMINGRINPEMGGSNVYVTMTMHVLVILFICIWVGFLLLISMVSIFNSLITSQLSSPFGWLGVGGFLLFGYVTTMAAFKIEANIARKCLDNLLEANDVIELGLFETEPSL